MKADPRTQEFSKLFSELDQDDQNMIVAYMGAISDSSNGLLSADAEASFTALRASNDEAALTTWLRENGYLASE